jgi:hypothetical protein
MIGGVEPIGDVVEPCVPRQTAGAVEGATCPVRDFVLVVTVPRGFVNQRVIHLNRQFVINRFEFAAFDAMQERRVTYVKV